MRCSGCGMTIPYNGSVCPYCHQSKDKDKRGQFLGFFFGVVLAVLGGMAMGWGGALVGFVLGGVIAGIIVRVGKSKPP